MLMLFTNIPFTNASDYVYYLDVVPGKSAWQLIQESGLFAKFVLFILILFSIISWAIMLWKWRQFSRVEAGNRIFLRKFRSTSSIYSHYESLSKIQNTPLAIMVRQSFAELENGRGSQNDLSKNPVAVLDEDHLRLFSDAAERAGEEESSNLGKHIPFLATTANTSPFLGLLGTVWGIMGSFSSIGVRGSASLAIVAPGIAEALIATVAGLAAAIPAVIGYNHFNSRLKILGVTIDNFRSELVSALRRENLNNKVEG